MADSAHLPTLPADPQAPLTLPEAADVMRISLRTLRRLIGRGDIKTVRIRRRVLVRRSAIEAYFDSVEI